MFRPRRRAALPVIVLACLSCLSARPGAAAAQGEEDNPRLRLPRSALDASFTAPILLTGYVGLGGGLRADLDVLAPAYGGAVVFRPGSADHILSFLSAWNCGLVLQGDYQNLSDTDNVLSADGIVRHYFRDRGRDGTDVRLYLGAGLGVTRFTEPGTGGRERDKYWSGVVEVGQEWLTRSHWSFLVRGQYRMHLRPHHNHGAWQVVAGIGLPFPG